MSHQPPPTKTELKKSWDRLSRYARAHKEESQIFHKLCEEIYGINWDMTSLADHDPIIDTIDYGTDDLSFEAFDKLIMEATTIGEHDE